jgi:hypothetical protein
MITRKGHKVIFYLVRHVLIGVDHGKLDFVLGLVQVLNGNFSCKQMFDCDDHSLTIASRYSFKKDISL